MYIYGNTVRQAEVMPQRQEEPRKEHKKKKLDRQILKNRRKAMRMNPAYVMFLSIAAVAALVVCVWYLQVRAELTSRTEHITELQQELADAKEEIADGEKKLEDLKVPDWYVWGRDQVTSTENYGQDAVRITNIGKFFPVIFFLVAALVSLTTMTRMIEEQRQQIGTLKALGYGDGDRGKISCLRTDVYHLRCICRSAAR